MKKLKKYYIFIIMDILFIVFNFLVIYKPEWYFLLGIPFWFCLMIIIILNCKNIIDTVIYKQKFNKNIFLNTALLILFGIIPYTKITVYLNYKQHYQERIEIIENVKKEINENNSSKWTKYISVNKNISTNQEVIVIKNSNEWCVIFNVTTGIISTEPKDYLFYTNIESQKLQKKIKENVISLNDIQNYEDMWYRINLSPNFEVLERDK